MSDIDLNNIINEFRSLRVYIGTTELDWLADFYKQGGAAPCIKALSWLTSLVEKSFTASTRLIDRTHSLATVLHECLAVLRVLLNTSVSHFPFLFLNFIEYYYSDWC